MNRIRCLKFDWPIQVEERDKKCWMAERTMVSSPCYFQPPVIFSDEDSIFR